MNGIRYGSVCSGIEAATMAWHSLGWMPAWFSEIEPFPCAVLAHHYPDVPNRGDMTQYERWLNYDAIDLLVGGTPCQSFSVAGLRKGLADPRGNLMLTFGAIAAKYRPRWLVWENVPGVLSSNGGRDFGTFLGMLVELGYGFAYRVLDAQYFGVPQRRRRVFVVGHFGDWHPAAAVLFERHSLSWHPAPSRETGEDTTRSVAPCLTGNYGKQPDSSDTSGEPMLIPSTGNVSHCLNAGGMGRQDYETKTLIAHTLRAEYDASEYGTGRGTPLVPVAFDTTQVTSPANRSNQQPGDPCHPLAAGAHAPAIAFHPTQDPISSTDGITHAMGTGSAGGCATIAVMQPRAIAWDEELNASVEQAGTLLRGGDGGRHDGVAVAFGGDIARTLQARHDSSPCADRGMDVVATAMQVRRLTPVECERLQGFPDGYTAIPWRNKPASECPDGPRYKALGNSMAVPVMRWIGRRIQKVEAIHAQREAA